MHLFVFFQFLCVFAGSFAGDGKEGALEGADCVKAAAVGKFGYGDVGILPQEFQGVPDPEALDVIGEADAGGDFFQHLVYLVG